MQSQRSIRGLGFGRKVAGIFALAAALAYGALASAAPGEGTDAVATGCGASAAPAAVPASGVEWSSSRGTPGKPY